MIDSSGGLEALKNHAYVPASTGIITNLLESTHARTRERERAISQCTRCYRNEQVRLQQHRRGGSGSGTYTALLQGLRLWRSLHSSGVLMFCGVICEAGTPRRRKNRKTHSCADGASVLVVSSASAASLGTSTTSRSHLPYWRNSVVVGRENSLSPGANSSSPSATRVLVRCRNSGSSVDDEPADEDDELEVDEAETADDDSELASDSDAWRPSAESEVAATGPDIDMVRFEALGRSDESSRLKNPTLAARDSSCSDICDDLDDLEDLEPGVEAEPEPEPGDGPHEAGAVHVLVDIPSAHAHQ